MTPDVVGVVGVVGVGRLGRVVARKLCARHDVLVCDVAERALRATVEDAGGRITVASFEEIASRASHVLFCTQARETLELLRRASDLGLTRPLYVSLVTRLSEREMREGGAMAPRLRVASAKLVGQFKAIEAGLPALFVVSHAEQVNALELLGCMGTVVVGPEQQVSVVNRTATRAALEVAEQFLHGMDQLDVPAEMAMAALRNVLVGTLLDHPADPENEYINSLLREMALPR
jgi:pyrroline-5-carboxylate reductase